MLLRTFTGLFLVQGFLFVAFRRGAAVQSTVQKWAAIFRTTRLRKHLGDGPLCRRAIHCRRLLGWVAEDFQRWWPLILLILAYKFRFFAQRVHFLQWWVTFLLGCCSFWLAWAAERSHTCVWLKIWFIGRQRLVHINVLVKFVEDVGFACCEILFKAVNLANQVCFPGSHRWVRDYWLQVKFEATVRIFKDIVFVSLEKHICIERHLSRRLGTLFSGRTDVKPLLMLGIIRVVWPESKHFVVKIYITRHNKDLLDQNFWIIEFKEANKI